MNVYINPCEFSGVKFDEKTRKSRIENDFTLLIGKYAGGRSTFFDKSCKAKPFKMVTYNLQLVRANLKLTALNLEGKETDQVMTIVTGPEEHVYLGLDLPVNSRKTLKYDTTKNSLVPTDKNPQLYFSLNYNFGDLAGLNEPDGFSSDNISAKLFVLASSRPLDSYGVGIGYRLPKKSFFGLDLSSTSVFAGRFWNKQDAISASGTALVNNSTASDWRFGLTFDLGTALAWVK